jgi:uncharacterized protein (TIGR03437 family)
MISIRVAAGLFLATLMTAAWGQSNLPVRWQAQYTQIYSEGADGTASTLGTGLQLQGGASVVTDPILALPGTASIRLKNYGAVATSPTVVPISGNATYIIEFKYHVFNYGRSAIVLPVYLIPAGDSNQQHLITVSNMAPSAPATGTFSAGAQTANAAQYFFSISASGDSDVVINDIRILRQDPAQQTTPPSAWASLENLPFPRLGKYFQGATSWQMRPGMLPYQYSVDQIEDRLAFNDVIAGLWVDTQTRDDPGSIRRLRQLNPNAVVLPYRMSGEQGPQQVPLFSQVSLDYSFLQSIPDEWYVKDTGGNLAVEDQYPDIRFMNISPFCPVVNGQTFLSFLLAWLNGKVFPSGLWDGVTLDNFFGEANIHIQHLSDPALLNFDYNRNGIRDETPASIGDMTRSANIGMLQQFHTANGDLQLVMGNAGSLPELSLAPYVNGYLQECVSDAWGGSNLSQASPAGWRGVFDAYRAMQETSRRPRINVLEGCGSQARRSDDSYLAPTSDDLRAHRLALGTTLLSDGFYSFDLHDNFTVPLWYDEYSVDARGTAVEDRTKKGYLGAALTDAVELTDGGSLMLQESFDRASLPPLLQANPASAVSVSNGTLIISNSDHTQNASSGVSTNPAVLPLNPGVYLITFDWTVLDTLDHPLFFDVTGSGQRLDGFRVPWVVTGDFGTVRFPFVIPKAGASSIEIGISGGGKVAIDNLRVVSGGVGPWRRDFQNGFVLANPLSQPHTFSAVELAGTLHRTGIHRIKGAQAPDINNGQSVSDQLTVGPFDAIILLADPIRLNAPIVTGVSNAAGGQAGVASGAFVSIYGSNFTPLAYDDWNKSISNGRLPMHLDGVNVSIGGKPAYVYAITPSQINVQAPDVDSGTLQVVVTTPAGASAPFTVSAQLYSPAFFPLPDNQPVATHPDYSIAAKSGTFSGITTVAAKPGEVITLWGTGFGPTNPIVPAGQEPAGQAPQTQATVSVTLRGIAVPVLGSVLSSYAATYQIAIQIPASITDGDYPILASVNGVQSPGNVMLAVRH